MSTTLTVPAEIVGHLRCGLHMELGHAAGEIATLSTLRDRESYPDWYAELSRTGFHGGRVSSFSLS